MFQRNTPAVRVASWGIAIGLFYAWNRYDNAKNNAERMDQAEIKKINMRVKQKSPHEGVAAAEGAK